MANYSSLIGTINAAIKTNGSGLITGQLLQTILDGMVASLGDNYQFAGVATPSTNPGTPDQNVFYIASEAGTYSNFSGIVVAENECAILKWDGTWAKDTTGAATAEQLNQLGQEMQKSLFTVEWELGGIDSNGQEEVNNVAIRSEFVKIKDGASEVYYTGANSQYYGLALYANKGDSQCISGTRKNRLDASSYHIDLSSYPTAKYVRFFSSKSDVSVITNVEQFVEASDFYFTGVVPEYRFAELSNNIREGDATKAVNGEQTKIPYDYSRKNKLYLYGVEWMIGYIESDGSIATQNYGIVTKNLVKLEDGATSIRVISSHLATRIYISLYSENNISTFISGSRANKIGEDVTFDISSFTTAKYALVSIFENNGVSDLDDYVKAAEIDLIGFTFKQETIKSELSGKFLSIVGDSTSTYSGTMPSGYSNHYPAGDVQSVDDQWWKKLIDSTGLVLLRNCSWAASKVAGYGNQESSAYAGWSPQRIADLTDGVHTPDIVVVWIGINDVWLTDVFSPIGNWNSKLPITLPTGDQYIADFSLAYAAMIWRIMSTYPTAKVYCCTLVNNTSKDQESGYPVGNGTYTLEDYNAVIRDVCNGLGASLIDLCSCGINYWNTAQYTIDGLHPNKAGFNLVYDKIKKALLSN